MLTALTKLHVDITNVYSILAVTSLLLAFPLEFVREPDTGIDLLASPASVTGPPRLDLTAKAL